MYQTVILLKKEGTYTYTTYFVYNCIRLYIVTSKPQDSLFLREIQSFEGGKEERSNSLRFLSLSLSQVTLVRARVTSRAHLCKAPNCGPTSDLRALKYLYLRQYTRQFFI